MSDKAFAIAWLSILVPFLLAFGIFETWAFVIHRPDVDTLSAQVWKWIGTRHGWTGWHIPLRIIVIALFLWLAEHFGFGWF